MDHQTSEMKASAGVKMVADCTTLIEKGKSTGRVQKVYLNKSQRSISSPYSVSVVKWPNTIINTPHDIDLPFDDRMDSDELDKVKTYFVSKPGSGAHSCDIRHGESFCETSQKNTIRPPEQEDTHTPLVEEMENSCSMTVRPADKKELTRSEGGARGKTLQEDKGFENYRTKRFWLQGIQPNRVPVTNFSEFPRKRQKSKVQSLPLIDKLKRPEHKVLGFMEDHIEYNSTDNVVNIKNVVGLDASSTKRATVLESTLDGTLVVGARRTSGPRMNDGTLDSFINCAIDSGECTADPLITMDKWGLKSENHRYKCSKCEVSGRSKKVVEEHLKEHHGEENDAVVVVLLGGFAGGRLCPFCHQRLKSKSFFKHVRQEHLEKFPYRCGFCSFLGQDRNQIYHHIRNKHKTYDYQVVDALGTVREMEDNKDKLHKHLQDSQMEDSKSPPSLVCPICSKVFKAFPYVKRHLQQHKKQRFKCSYCFFVSPCKSQMQAHFKRKHVGLDPSWDLVTARCSANKVLVDDVGPYMQQLIEDYGMHKPKADKQWVRQYSCPHCEYTCSFNSSFNRHLRIHEGRKPYKCKYCSFRAREAYTVRKHCGIKHKGLAVEIEYDEHYKAPYRYAKKDEELVNENKVFKTQAVENALSNNPAEGTTSVSAGFNGIALTLESINDGKHDSRVGERAHKETQVSIVCTRNKVFCDKDQDGNIQRKILCTAASKDLATIISSHPRIGKDVESGKELSESNSHVEHQEIRVQSNKDGGLCLKNSSYKSKECSCEAEKQDRKCMYKYHVSTSCKSVEKGGIKKCEDTLVDMITLGAFDEQENLPKLVVIEVNTPEQGQLTGKMWMVEGEEKGVKRNKRKRVKEDKKCEGGKVNPKRGRREKKEYEDKEKNEENNTSHEDIIHNQLNIISDSLVSRSGNRISSTPGVMTRDLLGLDYRNLEYFSPEMVRAMRGESNGPDSDRVVCKVCRVSTTKRAFYKHAKKHFHVKPFKCGHCNYRSIEKSKIRVHNTFCHPNLSCVIEKLNPKTATMPVNRTIQSPSRTTSQTGLGISSQESVDEEAMWCVVVETGQNMWWCHTCGIDVCGGEAEVQVHVTARNDYLSLLAAANATQQPRPQDNKQPQASTQHVFECPLCQKTLRSHTTSIRRHLYAHYGYKPYRCGYCSYTALCPGEVKQHNVSHRQQRPPHFVLSGAVMPSELQHILSIYCSSGPNTQPRNTATSKQSINSKDSSTSLPKGRGGRLNQRQREKEAWPYHGDTMLEQSKYQEEHADMSEETMCYQSMHSLQKMTQGSSQTFPLQPQSKSTVRSECEREEEEGDVDMQDEGAVRGRGDMEGDGASITLYTLEDYEDGTLLGHPSTPNPFSLLHSSTRMDDLAFIHLS